MQFVSYNPTTIQKARIVHFYVLQLCSFFVYIGPTYRRNTAQDLSPRICMLPRICIMKKKTHADIKHQVNINNPVICTNLLVVTPFPFLVRSRAGREHRFWVRLRGRPSGSAAPLGSNLPCLSPWPILKPGFWQPKAPSPPNPGETPLGFVSSQPGRLRRAADDFGAQGGRRGWLAGARAGR